MNFIKIGVIVGAFLVANSAYSADTNWTATITKVITYQSGVVAVVLTGESSPNPSSAVFLCDADIVYLGSKSNEAHPALISSALTAYTAKKTVRIGVTGSGGNCTTDYLTLQ